MEDFTYDEAVEIRKQYLEMRKQLPRIIAEGKKGHRTMTGMAKDFQMHRAQLYNILGERNEQGE
jgi:hypothetical protein